MKANVEPTPVGPREIASISVLGARATWVLAGPLALAGITYGIVSRGTGWLTGLDAAFGAVVVLMLLARRVEFRSGSATSLTGEPATPAAYRCYMTLLPVLAAAVWIVANVLGNHILK
jgi:hypothetical protein